MSVSESVRTHAADDNSHKRFQRYVEVILPLTGVPFIIVNWLMNSHRFDQLSLTLQWALMVLVFVGGLSMIRVITLPRWRSLWVRPCREHWLAPPAVAFITLIIAFIVTGEFAVVSTFLYLQGIATTSPERPLTDPVNDSYWYYIWNFLNAIPILELPQTLGLDLPFRYTDPWNRLLLLIYKIVLIGPVIATTVLIWRDARRLRYKTKGPERSSSATAPDDTT